ncbi:MAG: entericidin [Proteobacteria bacterium]|nr:entericidin [Pseudomonadota bacterium]
MRKTRQGIVILALLALAACNTVQGAGQDLESIGRKGEEVIKGD